MAETSFAYMGLGNGHVLVAFEGNKTEHVSFFDPSMVVLEQVKSVMSLENMAKSSYNKVENITRTHKRTR
jgi:hypothetical protein